MRPNCRITYVRLDTRESWEEEFHDPYIYVLPDGRVIRWDGYKYEPGVSYGGRPIIERLAVVRDLSRPPPPQPA